MGLLKAAYQEINVLLKINSEFNSLWLLFTIFHKNIVFLHYFYCLREESDHYTNIQLQMVKVVIV
jgi:hypothetical protein